MPLTEKQQVTAIPRKVHRKMPVRKTKLPVAAAESKRSQAKAALIQVTANEMDDPTKKRRVFNYNGSGNIQPVADQDVKKPKIFTKQNSNSKLQGLKDKIQLKKESLPGRWGKVKSNKPVAMVQPVPAVQSVTKAKAPKTKEQWDLSCLSSELDIVCETEVLPPGVLDIDSVEKDIFHAPDYASDIMSYLMSQETKFLLKSTYLEGDKVEVNTSMRAVLFDWLIQVQSHLQLEQESLHLAVALTDQFLARQKISLTKLQLVGITCILIATKFYERFPPAVDTLTRLTDNTYTFKEVIEMELIVLRVLKFQVNVPSPLDFLNRYMKVAAEYTPDPTTLKQLENASKYMLDLGIPEISMVQYPASMKAAAALCLARRCILGSSSSLDGPTPDWTLGLFYYTTYNEAELMPCMKRYSKMLLRVTGSKYQGAYVKYSSKSRFQGISKSSELNNSQILNALVSGDKDTTVA